MNNSKKILPLTLQIYRQVVRNASSESYPVSARYSKFLAKRAKLEIPDETPVHIKYGFGDKLMCQATWILAVVATGLSIEVLYKLTVGKK